VYSVSNLGSPKKIDTTQQTTNGLSIVILTLTIAWSDFGNQEQYMATTSVTNEDVLEQFAKLYHEVFSHDGYGDIRLEMKILRRGQKEIIIHCGKQYRFVVDYSNRLKVAAAAVKEKNNIN
jgi:hypothetical protein